VKGPLSRSAHAEEGTDPLLVGRSTCSPVAVATDVSRLRWTGDSIRTSVVHIYS
jgi:hypothetical protein